MIKKIFGILMMISLSMTTAFADIIDPGMPYEPRPRPIPDVPVPEPVDDGEVIVIKTLLIVGMIATMALVVYLKNKKIKVKEQ